MGAGFHPDVSLPQADAWSGARVPQVLIVDDDPLIRETLEQIICALHFGDVTQAASGREAIHLITADPERFDIIFCDLQMPGSDGLDVLEACAQAGLRGAVVLMSGSGEHNLRAAVERAGAFQAALASILAKPFSVAEVKSLLLRFTPAAR
jgi:CheY-like chemotaxis protein